MAHQYPPAGVPHEVGVGLVHESIGHCLSNSSLQVIPVVSGFSVLIFFLGAKERGSDDRGHVCAGARFLWRSKGCQRLDRIDDTIDDRLVRGLATSTGCFRSFADGAGLLYFC